MTQLYRVQLFSDKGPQAKNLVDQFLVVAENLDAVIEIVANRTGFTEKTSSEWQMIRKPLEEKRYDNPLCWVSFMKKSELDPRVETRRWVEILLPITETGQLSLQAAS